MALVAAFDKQLLLLVAEYEMIWRKDDSPDSSIWVDAAFKQIVMLLSLEFPGHFPDEYFFLSYVKRRWQILRRWWFQHHREYTHTSNTCPSARASERCNAMAFLVQSSNN
ncbi:uncharacterized protein [Fopius arisanus]|uniref:Uncharacterized protein n=1 Tax=Fopius arisanus TaxID=64838 RepID=A0A9R1TQK0_9HYME|nr:PREDICTED: uncharacterized protein LOC105272717 [Fopius arisanus]